MTGLFVGIGIFLMLGSLVLLNQNDRAGARALFWIGALISGGSILMYKIGWL